jgi:hypothetical protein
MDIHKVIVELRAELELLDNAILSIERLAPENHRTEVGRRTLRPACRANERGKGRRQRSPAESQTLLNAR